MNTTQPTIGRRRLLGTGLALGTAGTLGLAGCAGLAGGSSGGPSIGRVVVVGGGFGGATAARYLRLWGGNIEVTLVERNEQFVSCPMSNLVLGGYRRMQDITRSYDGLRAAGVKLLRGEVVAVDGAARRVRLADGTTLPYDRLVLSPGIDFIPGAVGGLQAAGADQLVPHAWKAGPQTALLRRQLEDMRDGGVYALSIPKVPYRCPPGPYERACMVASYFKVHKPRSKVLVLDANPEIQSKKGLFEKAFKEHYAGMLEYRASTELKEVDVAARLARFEFEDVKADVLNVVPPQRAGEIARSAGVVNMAGRWVGVNWLTLEATAVSAIHVLGDATFSAPAMPKSGHMANQQAKVAAAAIIQLLRGEPVNPAPVVMNTCYSFLAEAEACHVASVHQFDAAEKTFKPVPGSGGVSAAGNRSEAGIAQVWAENTWVDTLAG